AENGFDRAAAFENENNLIGATIPVILVLAVGFFRPATPRRHVLVEQNRHAAAVEIAAAGDVRGFQVMMAERTLGGFPELLAFQQLHAAYARRRPQVITDRERFIEPGGREDVLIIDTLVFVTRPLPVAMEPDVMLPRHLA